MRIITSGTAPNGAVIENRSYNNWPDAHRARAQLRRQGARCMTYLDVAGPALHVVRPSPVNTVHEQ